MSSPRVRCAGLLPLPRLAPARALGVLVLALVTGGCAWLAPVPLWEQPPPPVRDAPVVDSARLHRAELANGLRVRILEDHRLPSFALGVIVPRGVGIESREQAGLAELTAEVMERGAGERDALQLAEVVDSLGASLSVSAGWDSSSAQVSGLSRDLDPLFDVLADVVLRPRFDAEEVAKVRSERMGRLRHAADDPGTLASWNLARVLYPKHRYGLPSMGTLASVGKLQAAAARAFHHSIFTPRGAIFYAVGDVDPRTLLARVCRAYGDWSGG